MKKKIMILGAGILQLPAIRQAKEMGLHAVAVDMNPDAVGFAEADTCLVISTIDIPRVVEAAKELRVDGVMTLASDMPMRTVAAVAEALGLVGPDEETALRATDKAAMRRCLSEHGVPCPKFFVAASKEEYLAAVARIEGAFIVKPADNSGSRGVFMLRDASDREAVEKAYTYSHAYSRGGEVMVEEYMVGPEVSVETLTVDGVCHVIQITDKLTTGAPHFVEMGHSQPTGHSAEAAERIRQVAMAAGKAVGIENGPSHTEIIVTRDGPKIVELGARLGGDCITTHLVPLSTGVNMVEACIRIALGEKPDIEPKYERGSAIRYVGQRAGVIREIRGLEEARGMAGVEQVSMVVKEGDRVSEVNSSAARAGFVIASGGNASDAAEACERALGRIRLEMEEEA